MKKIIYLISLILLLSVSNVYATWRFEVHEEAQKGHYIKFSVKCISDGSAQTIIDILPYMNNNLKTLIRGETFMVMKIRPSTVAVPNTTINVTLSDDEKDAFYTTTGQANNATSWHKLYNDIGPFPMIFNYLHVTFNDIGDAGDEFDLVFIVWKEDL